jgi:hypothetical protein
MTSVDSSNMIGGASWNNLTPLTGTPAQKPAVAPASTPESAPASIGDGVELSAGATATPAAPSFAPQAETPAAAPRAEIAPSQVPVSLLADDATVGLVGSAGGASSAHPTSGLGVLAQLDEVRAIDNGTGTNRFADFHLVGVNNAAQFLGNPNAMYLGI